MVVARFGGVGRRSTDARLRLVTDFGRILPGIEAKVKSIAAERIRLSSSKNAA